jgi:hypothetical protein
VQLAHKEFKAFKAQKDQLEPQVLLDHKAAQGLQVYREMWDQQEQLELQVIMGLLDRQGLLALLEMMELQARQALARKAQQELQAQRERFQ